MQLRFFKFYIYTKVWVWLKIMKVIWDLLFVKKKQVNKMDECHWEQTRFDEIERCYMLNTNIMDYERKNNECKKIPTPACPLPFVFFFSASISCICPHLPLFCASDPLHVTSQVSTWSASWPLGVCRAKQSKTSPLEPTSRALWYSPNLRLELIFITHISSSVVTILSLFSLSKHARKTR